MCIVCEGYSGCPVCDGGQWVDCHHCDGTGLNVRGYDGEIAYYDEDGEEEITKEEWLKLPKEVREQVGECPECRGSLELYQ